jgi:hypothetical protein
MPLGLYICTLLTHSTAPSLARGRRPSYPKDNPLDGSRRLDVFILSLLSLKGLKIDKVLLNVEFSPEFGDRSVEVRAALRLALPHAQIVLGAKRPTTLTEWISSTAQAKKLFGPEAPVLCLFNHDHILTDPNPDLFQSTVERAFQERTDCFLNYSHAPEANSLIRNAPAHRGRLRANLGIDRVQTTPKPLLPEVYYTEQEGFIDSIFVASPNSLAQMWAAARAQTSYIPRPDWVGVSFPAFKFKVLLSRREFFRHFDGYGHISAIPELQGLRLLDFDGAGEYLRRKQLCLGLSIASPAAEQLDALAEEYHRLFREVHLLSLRDEHFSEQIRGASTFRFVEHLSDALDAFLQAQVLPDLASSRLSEGARVDLITSLSGKVFARQLELFQACHADVLTIPPVPTLYKRLRSRLSRLTKRGASLFRIQNRAPN